jgi:pimeloyl-ACP methyl ester carboxylesterase
VELTEVLGWGQFTLLGHSMGGMIAQELVLRLAGAGGAAGLDEHPPRRGGGHR